MTKIFIFLAQSVTAEVIEIILLLLVSAIIGYVTAWFYSKSVYTPVIKGLESDNEGLKKQVSGMKEDIKQLNGKIGLLGEKISSLEKDIASKDKDIEELKNPVK
jgi:peptidoglycan hydrolase CwlO-like protein